MSVKDIKEGMEKKKVLFGIRQALKHKKDVKQVFVAKDARDDVIEKLKKEKLDVIQLKTKRELTKMLNLDFESEVFSIVK